MPVYLNKTEFITDRGIELKTATIVNHNIAIEPQAPTVEFYNTGNFQPAPINNFRFVTEVKDGYNTGASRCQQISIILFTTDIPISIPIATPGCIASLTLLDGNTDHKGSDTDLSGFGIDPTTWVKVELLSEKGTINVMVNNKVVYVININNPDAKILGLGYTFQGSAAIRNVYLYSGKKVVFSNFN